MEHLGKVGCEEEEGEENGVILEVVATTCHIQSERDVAINISL